MTEEEWLESSDFELMLDSLGDPHWVRKLRHFIVACFHQQWRALPDDRCRQCVVILERHIAGTATEEELTQAIEIAHAAFLPSWKRGEGKNGLLASAVWIAMCDQRSFPGETVSTASGVCDHLANATEDYRSTSIAQCGLLRCIVGNPFRPVAFAPEWRTTVAVGIAAQMYESREFGNLPVLADALEEAGCDHPAVLAHCREPGEHARGCWVVDGVLGKC